MFVHKIGHDNIEKKYVISNFMSSSELIRQVKIIAYGRVAFRVIYITYTKQYFKK